MAVSPLPRFDRSLFQVIPGIDDGVETIALHAPGDRLVATFAPGAGLVCSSLRHDGEELLGRNGGLAAYAATGAVMGIPLLHPWANRLAGWGYRALGRDVDLRDLGGLVPADDRGLPIHGTLPGRWRVAAAMADERCAVLSADLDGASAAFPFRHRIYVQVVLEAEALRVRTTVAAAEAGEIPVAFGYHPYLRLPGVPRGDWHVELPVTRRLVLDPATMIPTGATEVVEPVAEPLGDAVYDDGFDRLASPRAFALAGGGRRIEVAFEQGYGHAQVFAPPASDVICFEPMTAPANALRAGGFATATARMPYVASFSVRVLAA